MRIVFLMSLVLAALAAAATGSPDPPRIERVSSAAPFPRGLAVLDGKLYVLCRGRVRSSGGVTAEVEDQAGTIYVMDPNVTEPALGPVGASVRENGTVLARPSTPPFRLWDRASDPPHRDRWTDRPYCTLRFHAPTRSLYLCAFSGVDKPSTAADRIAFSKNLTDALLRYDLRTGRWYELERHDLEAGGSYPHADPATAPPPHGWLNGPDNCLPLGEGLYAVAKDNSRLVRYDLSAIARDPEAGPPRGEVVLGDMIELEGRGATRILGHSALAYRDGWLYLGCRTSSVIVRVPLDASLRPVTPIRGQLVARFDPWDPLTLRSANLTDIAFDDRGRLYVISAQPARVYRFTPDPHDVFDARNGRVEPWVDLAGELNRPAMKSENLLHHDGWLYVTSGNGYDYQAGADGMVYRVRVD